MRAPPLILLVLTACSSSTGLLTGLDERAANEVLVALGEAGVPAEKLRAEGQDATFSVAVPAAEAARAHRVLAERALPRTRPPGVEEVFAKGSMVPTPLEEQARYAHALAGELARSIESVDGVLEARVHLGLARADPLRPGDAPPPRASVLVKCRPAACDAVRALEGGLRALVAGAADGLDPGAVAVVIAPGAAPGPPPEPAGRRGNALLLGLAALAGTGAIGLAGAGLLGRLRGGAR
ncbi:MAG: secretion protein [Anaeromyxobacteraceae bacterium]